MDLLPFMVQSLTYQGIKQIYYQLKFEKMRMVTNLRVALCTAMAFLLAASTALAQSGQYDWSGVMELGSYPGIKHSLVSVTSPRLMNINVLQVDTTTPNLSFYTTPRSSPWIENVEETQRKTTRTFINESQSTETKVVAAVNAGPWSPWPPVPPDDWNTESPANLSGLAVSEGTLVSPGSGGPSVIVENGGTVSMAATSSGYDISNVQTAVTGFSFVLTNGNPTGGGGDLHPRTGIGLSQDGRYVYLMTIDGRQFSSKGATTGEVGSWMKHFGAHTGINMDGGGSTTMAWWNPDISGSDKSELLNFPVGTACCIPLERTVGNSIGVYYVTGSSIPGDFDGDGDVDGKDFLEWQRGESPNQLSAEDLPLWVDQFGTTSTLSLSATIPEPATLLLAMFGLSAIVINYRRKRMR